MISVTTPKLFKLGSGKEPLSLDYLESILPKDCGCTRCNLIERLVAEIVRLRIAIKYPSVEKDKGGDVE